MTSDYLVSTEMPEGLGVTAIVLAANHHSPFECLDEISKDLNGRSVRGAIAFDLLLANGNKINRYFLANFDGESFALDSIRKFGGEYENLSRVSAQVLKQSAKFIDAVLLTPAMKFAVSRGIPL